MDIVKDPVLNDSILQSIEDIMQGFGDDPPTDGVVPPDDFDSKYSGYGQYLVVRYHVTINQYVMPGWFAISTSLWEDFIKIFQESFSVHENVVLDVFGKNAFVKDSNVIFESFEVVPVDTSEIKTLIKIFRIPENQIITWGYDLPTAIVQYYGNIKGETAFFDWQSERLQWSNLLPVW